MSQTSTILQWLRTQGILDICLCPGGRNASFVQYLTEIKDFNTHTSFDERSAGFFALGLSQKNKRPVAIITTSGTAVAEVLPSVMEAYYSNIPIVIISADRPKRLRGTGAPQAVDQVNIFGVYAQCVDIENDFTELHWNREKPIHLNVCFDEPLLDDEVVSLKPAELAPLPFKPIKFWTENGTEQVPKEYVQRSFDYFLRDKTNPLLLVGTLSKDEAVLVKPFVEAWPGPIYCESTSGLRELKSDRQLVSGDRILLRAWQEKKMDAVVRLGGVPTARLWRSLETADFPLFSFSSRPFPGLSRGTFFCGSYDELICLEPPVRALRVVENDLFSLDKSQLVRWGELVEKYPESEPALVAWLSRQISTDASTYIGNSLPIREWDLLASRENPVHVLANRGANGIDGQLSTALAFLDSQKPLWVILGDLTTLYDSNALWFWKKSPHPLKLVVINNKGGQIFSRMFQSPLFTNSHDLDFSHWAAQWGLQYRCVPEAQMLPSDSCLIELQPDEQQTRDFWREYDVVWAK